MSRPWSSLGIATLTALAGAVAVFVTCDAESLRATVVVAIVTFVVAATLGGMAASIRQRETDAIIGMALRLRRIARREPFELAMPEGLGAEAGEIASCLLDAADVIRLDRAEHERRIDDLRELFDALGEGFLAIDHDKRILLGNEAFCELFGAPRPVIGKPYFEVVRHHAVVAAFDRAIEGIRSIEHTNFRIGSTEREIEMRVFPRGNEGEIAAVALFIDVSRLRHLERVRSEFLANFSHEVRTPLAGIRSALETLAVGGLNPSDEEQLRKIMTRQTARLERLVLDLAELNSIESGATELELAPVDVARLLADLAVEWSERAADAGMTIAVDARPVTATIDAQRIEQVISNLVENGIKHAGPSPELRLSARERDGNVEIRVSDQGYGIPDEEREKVFHRLYRLDRSRSADTGGSGLGLAIAKHIVRLHRGTIGVEDHEGKGTTFLIVLPIDASHHHR